MQLLATTEIQTAADLELESLPSCPLCDGAFDTIDPEICLARCKTCGFVFDNPRPTLRAIVSFYSKPQQYDSWVKAQKARDKLWERRLRKFLPLAKSGTLLDVGTGIGQFLEQARPHFSSVCGTEISESAVRIGKERYGLNIIRGEVQEVFLSEAPFDNVTLFHVLEHVPFAKATLDYCAKLLTEDGILLICVPNEVLAWTSRIKAAGRELRIRAFRKFSRKYGISRAGSSREIHLSRFTPAVLKGLLNHCGFQVIDEGLDPYYVPYRMPGFLHSLYFKFHKALFQCFGINRYDTIWMVARKKTS